MRERIEINPNVCHGQPCIKGTRIMVYLILELLREGLTPEDIIKDYYPNLSVEDVKSCLDYAAFLIKEQEFISFEEVV